MGLGKGFWEELLPVKQLEDLNSLRDKRLAVDLSYWLVQQQTALRDRNVRKPHLRLTFYRVVNLVARVGVRPVFVVDGERPPLKQTFRKKSTVKNLSFEFNNLRNGSIFNRNVEESVVLLKHLGMPVLRAAGEAEKLCAELDREGLVDACVTADSDAFVHGAKHVIKNLRADYREPLVEIYRASDIEEKLGLQQKHLVALALLVGCDYSPRGVPGVGCSNALRLIRCFSESQILDRMRAWGQGEPPLEADVGQHYNPVSNVAKYTHCSKCGHLGNRRTHANSGCKACCASTNGLNEVSLATGCKEKSKQFTCSCPLCREKARQKTQNQSRDWWSKICGKMASTPGFPDENIIDIFLQRQISSPGDIESLASSITWQSPNMEELESFLGKQLLWDATYVRQKTLPLLSHFCLTERAAMNSGGASTTMSMGLINGLFCPISIERIKIDRKEPCFVLKWVSAKRVDGEHWLGRRAKPCKGPKPHGFHLVTSNEVEQKVDSEDLLTSETSTENFIWEFSTSENVALVRAACPGLAKVYDEEQVFPSLEMIAERIS